MCAPPLFPKWEGADLENQIAPTSRKTNGDKNHCLCSIMGVCSSCCVLCRGLQPGQVDVDIVDRSTRLLCQTLFDRSETGFDVLRYLRAEGFYGPQEMWWGNSCVLRDDGRQMLSSADELGTSLKEDCTLALIACGRSFCSVLYICTNFVMNSSSNNVVPSFTTSSYGYTTLYFFPSSARFEMRPSDSELHTTRIIFVCLLVRRYYIL